ncbi:MAG: DUF4861 family protein [Bacteroidota bacterium]
MTMGLNMFFRILACCLATTAARGQELEILVTNPYNVRRANEPVVVPYVEIQKNVPTDLARKLRLLDESNRSMAFQVDDLDGNGSPDEFVFVADFAPNQDRRFVLTSGADSLALPAGPFRTDVANFKRIGGVSVSVDDDDGPGTLRSQGQYPFDGVGWESEVIGYRLYLDERNAVDIQAKKIPGLHWAYIGNTGVNYQLDAYWGMDPLHVGGALGIGGMGFWIKDAVNHPMRLDRRRCRVIARGPVRAVARVDYDGWDIGGEKVDVTSLFVIYGGDRMTEHRVMLRSAAPRTIAVGIVKHAHARASWDPAAATMFTVGAQSRTNDSLLMALTFDPAAVVRKTEDKANHLVLLRLDKNTTLRYFISAYWQGETGTMLSESGTKDLLQTMRRRLTEPLNVRFMKPRP